VNDWTVVTYSFGKRAKIAFEWTLELLTEGKSNQFLEINKVRKLPRRWENFDKREIEILTVCRC
jgi:hypothetical protein